MEVFRFPDEKVYFADYGRTFRQLEGFIVLNIFALSQGYYNRFHGYREKGYEGEASNLSSSPIASSIPDNVNQYMWGSIYELGEVDGLFRRGELAHKGVVFLAQFQKIFLVPTGPPFAHLLLSLKLVLQIL